MQEQQVSESVGKRIAAARDGSRLSQQTLAEMVGVTVGVISRIERGDTLPDLSTSVAVADALNSHIDILVGRAYVDQNHAFKCGDRWLYALPFSSRPEFSPVCVVRPIKTHLRPPIYGDFAASSDQELTTEEAQQGLLPWNYFYRYLRDRVLPTVATRIPIIRFVWKRKELRESQVWRAHVSRAFSIVCEESRRSVAQIAHDAGVPAQTIKKIQLGTIVPDLMTIWRLAEALSLPIDEIIGRDHDDGALPLVLESKAFGSFRLNCRGKAAQIDSNTSRATFALQFAEAHPQEFAAYLAQRSSQYVPKEESLLDTHDDDFHLYQA